MWTRDQLHDLVRTKLRGFKFICVANREPYIHERGPEGIRLIEPASGVVTALDPVLRATGGTWIAHGSGSADRETADRQGRLRVPPGEEAYTLRRVWLTPEEEAGYYYGFSNEALWPLCHIAYRRPTFEEADWEQYVRVNEKFARTVIEEVGNERALVFIQDYHFALLPRMIKQKLPEASVFQFWHIPWPNPEAFRICPWEEEILQGLLGNDLLAFHILYHCNNFLDTIDRDIEARTDRERMTVFLRGSPTLVRPHPISVDFDEISREASSPATLELSRAFRRKLGLGDLPVILGIDRLDYTKGIPERLRAVDRLLERHPGMKGNFVFLEVGVPSRSRIPAYRRFQEEVEVLTREINERHRTGGWEPVRLVAEHQDRASVLALYRIADVCVVTSLHDGMNLVAKEYVAARSDLRGALVLSRFTGAARELTQALLVNPYATDATAQALHEALTLAPKNQADRMERLRMTVSEHNVFAWIGTLLEQAVKVEPSPL